MEPRLKIRVRRSPTLELRIGAATRFVGLSNERAAEGTPWWIDPGSTTAQGSGFLRPLHKIC